MTVPCLESVAVIDHDDSSRVVEFAREYDLARVARGDRRALDTLVIDALMTERHGFVREIEHVTEARGDRRARGGISEEVSVPETCVRSLGDKLRKLVPVRLQCLVGVCLLHYRIVNGVFPRTVSAVGKLDHYRL